MGFGALGSALRKTHLPLPVWHTPQKCGRPGSESFLSRYKNRRAAGQRAGGLLYMKEDAVQKSACRTGECPFGRMRQTAPIHGIKRAPKQRAACPARRARPQKGKSRTAGQKDAACPIITPSPAHRKSFWQKNVAGTLDKTKKPPRRGGFFSFFTGTKSAVKQADTGFCGDMSIF